MHLIHFSFYYLMFGFTADLIFFCKASISVIPIASLSKLSLNYRRLIMDRGLS